MIDPNTSKRIMDHLVSIGLVEENQGVFKNASRIKRGVDYKTVDLKLPRDLIVLIK